MARKKLKQDSELDSFDFEKAVPAGSDGVNKEVLAEAKIRSKIVDEARTKKVLKSVRYDSKLLAQVKKLAKVEGIPYQTLMNSLLRAGLESRKTNLIDRVKRIERKLFKKHG